jgi:sugar O-acyltransferase (sialic acid O-acetyltransferase NeuD family)
MNVQKLILVGGGGHCRSCIEVVQSIKQYEIAGVIDKDKNKSSILGFPIIGDDDCIPACIKENQYQFVITLGQIKNSAGRRNLFEFVRKYGGEIPEIIASSAFVSKYAKISNGTTIMHNAFVNANAVVGSACIINTGALIEHDVVIGDYCHLSTKVVINGGVQVGSDCFIGSGAIISHNISICNNCTIGAGTVVVHSIEEPGVYVGNPARRIAGHG